MDEVPENDKPAKGPGRKSKWDPRMIEEAYLYCLEHHGIDRDLAEHLGIGYSTLYLYMEQYPEFLEAIKRGRKQWCQSGCYSIVRSMYQRAERQEHRLPKIRVKRVWDEAQKKMVVVERTITIEKVIYQGDQRAAEFILLNKDPENWKVRPEGTIAIDAVAFAAQVQQAMKEADEFQQPAPVDDATTK